MYFLKVLATFAILITQSEAKTENETLQMEIESLQKQRNDLFKQINDAIDDSVKNLKISNDSDALLGISFITDLKDKLKEMNDTNDETLELDVDNQNKSKTYDDNDKVNMRRQLDNWENQMKLIDETRKQKDLDKEFRDKLFDNRHKSERDRNRFENREEMAKRVHEWLKVREIAKAKKKQISQDIKNKYGKAEKCPRHGVDPLKARKGFSGKYPCCRKCCKFSMLGCLKKK